MERRESDGGHSIRGMDACLVSAGLLFLNASRILDDLDSEDSDFLPPHCSTRDYDERPPRHSDG